MLTQRPDLVRQRIVITAKEGSDVYVDQRRVKNFASNNYLGLHSHPALKQALIAGVEKYGLGSGASAMVSGYCRAHQALEEKFAAFLQVDRALLFNSGYQANIGIIRTLVARRETVLADKLCHASLLDGMQLAAARCRRYRHNDVTHLQEIVATTSAKLVVTESVFSMEGDISPLDQIAALTTSQKMALLVDDAHGIGVLGQQGRGVLEHFGLTQEDVTVLVAPLGKAFASMGAIVAGKHAVIESILQFAKSYCYSTALPPAVAEATSAALDIVEQETWRREQLQALIGFFKQEARQRGLPLIGDNITPIQCLLVGDNAMTLQLQQRLLAHGYLISCIRPPTVPVGTARIRISLTCLLTERDIVAMLDFIAEYYEKQG